VCSRFVSRGFQFVSVNALYLQELYSPVNINYPEIIGWIPPESSLTLLYPFSEALRTHYSVTIPSYLPFTERVSKTKVLFEKLFSILFLVAQPQRILDRY
jgi:hypothetical protein